MSYSKDHHQDVPLFTGTNYQQWSRRMACHLQGKDLEDVVGFDATTLAPSDQVPKLESREEKKRDGKAKAKIMNRLSDDILALADDAGTSHELWRLLHETYQRSSMAAVVSSLKSLINTRKLESQTISAYIAEIKTENAESRMNVLMT
jgi:hypothetical protein